MERHCQPVPHRSEVAIVGGAVGECDVQVALFLTEWVVRFAVHGEGEDGGVVLEDDRGPVPLMDVQIDDCDPLGTAGRAGLKRRHRHIVEHAESLAVTRAGMMGAAGQIDGEPVGKGRAHGRKRAADRTPRTLHQFRRPGESDAPNLIAAQTSRNDRTQVVGRVRPKQLDVGRRLRNQKLKSRVTFQNRPKKGILLHRKSVALGERKHELIAVESLHWREFNTAVVLLLIAIVSFSATGLTAQTGGRLDGRVVSDTAVAGGGPVQGAVVALLLDGETISSALSDQDGRFSVSGPSAVDLTLRILRIGFAATDVRLRFVEGEVVEREFVIEQTAVELAGIGVGAERSREVARFEEMAGVTTREMTSEELKLVPGIAEADPIRAIEVLPGVISTSDFSSSFNVRGGSADQNLILLDGVPIFSPFHLGGFFSVFSADMVDRAELQSGGFSAEHGGRVSSVLDIVSDPGTGEFEVDAGLSVLAARATVAGGAERLDQALGLRDTRWRVSGRRSYFDQILRPVTDFPYHLADLQGVLETRVGDRTLLRLSGYTGEDVLDLTTIDAESFPLRINWDWGNRVFGAGLSHEVLHRPPCPRLSGHRLPQLDHAAARRHRSGAPPGPVDRDQAGRVRRPDGL